ncbi:M24 family metallopeptidase [Thermosediminibacter litoriperuensis]|uniref:Xaa-Pro aminopeptidase/Xaa-Pro dipeptidase n=1 Tax=Thermosediminibacter litoriperuensis TaxID=291989 RepID=A0A5S5AL69_9FIRM|nr:Xaa-Pro peptidase family protein [Thermosediminibacter litoriperuensis]TYP51625.1 Xaa-Pro aminopeptidase/Xaa-Pro dipeptidase [Thermosediminibacter litoriperuensis]
MNLERISSLRRKLSEKDLDGILVSRPENQYYVSGFDGEGFLVVTSERALLFTDFRYIEQAKKESPDFEVVELEAAVSPFKKCADELKSLGLRNLAFEGHYLTVKSYEELKSFLDGIEVIKTDGLIEELRTRKDEVELEMIRKSQEITDKAFEHILNYIRPGVTESDLALEIEYFIKKNGADGLAFHTIVASGPRSSLPHGRPTSRKIQPGDFITLDFGAKFNHYCSDMTRTVVLGKPNKDQLEIYRIVLEAQKRALEYIKSGVLGKDVDKVARDFIEEKGFGRNFGHGLGHGVGLEIHEAPRLSQKGENPLLPGMVVTVEPGIYIENFGGVRIEDLVIIVEDGCTNLTKSPKDLICL